MKKEKPICLDDSQIKRLQTDTAKLAKGIHDDICPTVEEMYNENVPKELRISKAQKKKKEQREDAVERTVKQWIGRRILKKIEEKTEGFF